MIILFLGNIDLLGSLIFMTPIAIIVFHLLKRLFSKHSRGTNGNKIVLYSVVATFLLTPFIFFVILAIIIFMVI